MAAEVNFKNWVKDHLPRAWHWQAIETTTGRGIPDVNICNEAGEFWIEFKAEHTMPRLRPEQFAWLTRRHHCGGLVFLLHKHKAHWHLHEPDTWAPAPRPDGSGVDIVSGSLASGVNVQQLTTLILHLQHERAVMPSRN